MGLFHNHLWERRERKKRKKRKEGRKKGRKEDQGGREKIVLGSTEIFRKIKFEPEPPVLAENVSSFLVRWEFIL